MHINAWAKWQSFIPVDFSPQLSVWCPRILSISLAWTKFTIRCDVFSSENFSIYKFGTNDKNKKLNRCDRTMEIVYNVLSFFHHHFPLWSWSLLFSELFCSVPVHNLNTKWLRYSPNSYSIILYTILQLTIIYYVNKIRFPRMHISFSISNASEMSVICNPYVRLSIQVYENESVSAKRKTSFLILRQRIRGMGKKYKIWDKIPLTCHPANVSIQPYPTQVVD